MKNKIIAAAFLLGCQVFASSAAYASGDDDQRLGRLLEGAPQQIAQGDMLTADNSGGDDASASYKAGEGKSKHRHGGKRKHANKGAGKRRLSSRARAQVPSGATENTCCAPQSSGM